MQKQASANVKSELPFILKDFFTEQIAASAELRDKGKEVILHFLVTALSPFICYDKASAIAHHALDNNQTLKAGALASRYIEDEAFDNIVDPKKMAGVF